MKNINKLSYDIAEIGLVGEHGFPPHPNRHYSMADRIPHSGNNRNI